MSGLEIMRAGLLRIVGRSGNTVNALVKDGEASYQEVMTALKNSQHGFIELLGIDELRNDVKFAVFLDDVSLVFLFPPPSNLAIARPNIQLKS